MKNFNWAVFFGCCVIGISIFLSGKMIAGNMPGTTHVPSSLSVTTTDSTMRFSEYMSEYEAAAFLMMNTDDFISFIKTGELDGTFTKIKGNYVFKKDKLEEWINKRIDNESNGSN